MGDRGQEPLSNVQRRTRAAIIEGALDILRGGGIPSVTDASRAGGVSRATAYRYFPDRSSLLEAVLDETVRPLRWEADAPHDPNVHARLDAFLDDAFDRLRSGEAQLRAALRLELEQRAGDSGTAEPLIKRGTRVRYISEVLEPLDDVVPAAGRERLAAGLSALVGIEAYIVLRDIRGFGHDKTASAIRWACHALVDAATKPEPRRQGGRSHR